MGTMPDSQPVASAHQPPNIPAIRGEEILRSLGYLPEPSTWLQKNPDRLVLDVISLIVIAIALWAAATVYKDDRFDWRATVPDGRRATPATNIVLPPSPPGPGGAASPPAPN